MLHHVDRFHAAITVLAGHGHIKQRLIKAYEDNLSEISDDELPVALKQRFSDIRHQMTRVAPANGEGAVCASVRKMSIEEASECSAALVAFYGEIMKLGDSDDALLTVEGPGGDVVPPFLVKSN